MKTSVEACDDHDAGTDFDPEGGKWSSRFARLGECCALADFSSIIARLVIDFCDWLKAETDKLTGNTLGRNNSFRCKQKEETDIRGVPYLVGKRRITCRRGWAKRAKFVGALSPASSRLYHNSITTFFAAPFRSHSITSSSN